MNASEFKIIQKIFKLPLLSFIYKWYFLLKLNVEFILFQTSQHVFNNKHTGVRQVERSFSPKIKQVSALIPYPAVKEM